MADQFTDDDFGLLDELGVDLSTSAAATRSPKEQRIIAGFEEIQKFVEEHKRMPSAREDADIFERLYAVRLEALRGSAECRELLRELDHKKLLDQDADSSGNKVAETPDGEYGASAQEELSDEALLAALGVDLEYEQGDIFELKHVRSQADIKAAEEIAKRIPCRDFDTFKALFDQVQQELQNGTRKSIKFHESSEYQVGDWFILDGQKVLIAGMDKAFTNDQGRLDRRLRVIYDNGTESDLLLRSLIRALYKDKAGRRITTNDLGPLFSMEQEEDDIPSGCIYVLRSLSTDPFVQDTREVLHKIGVTGGSVAKRIANAKKDPTYLLADVEVVAEYKLSNINRSKLEGLIHRFFSPGRVDMELKDRFGFAVAPREWFLVPLDIIDKFITHLTKGDAHEYYYDSYSIAIRPISEMED